MNLRILVPAIFVCIGASADIISLGPVSLSGQGLGSVNTVLTMQSPGNSTTESGCIAAGIGGTTVTGPAACPGMFTGGDEQAINHTFSATSLGLTDFNNLRIIFNPSEPQNASARSISLDNLALTLWDPATGLILDAKNLPSAVFFPDTDPGVGNAGFAFKLDSAQAAVENGILSAFPDLFIGLAANASEATGGLETFSIGSISVPEPGSYLLIGAGLLGLIALRRRFAS
jgi:hypothetical protein